MKTIKYLLIFMLGMTSLSSCLVEDTEVSDLNETTANVAGFVLGSSSYGGISNGTEYTFSVDMSVKGPTSMALSGDVQVTVDVDPTSTAIEGTHFRLDSKSITLSKSNNYIGSLPITMLTQGIQAPLASNPVLKIMVTSADGSGNIMNNGKVISINLNYLCFSNLSGTYNATMVYTAYDGSTSNISFTDVWTETGVGEYRTSEVGHWIGGLGVGTPGYTAIDICNVISIGGQYLVDYYGNWVDDLGVNGSVDPVTGTITVDYSICYPAGDSNCRYYSVTYERQ